MLKKLGMLLFLVLPRLVVIGLWVGTGFFREAFDTWVFPLIGVVLAPFSVLTWAWISLQKTAPPVYWWGVLILAVIVDIVAGRVGGNKQLYNRYGRT
ncbi:MAG: hypothetical protein GC159_16200 [Phycisphaera sp.]|nr:hypothetical protein [Phycisphaera sp.]